MNDAGPTRGLDADVLDMMLQAIQEFADRHLPADLVLRLDHEDECPVELVRMMCGEDLGIHLLFVPEEYGGMGGGSFDVCRVCEKMAAIDLGVATSVLATALGSDPIAVGATGDQKKLWLTRLAEEGLLFAYGATEPEAGSDLGALRTTATPIEQDGSVVGYRLNGRKQWISNGGIADAYTILANTPGGPSWFVIERGAEGFTQANPEDKHGIRLSNTAALYLDDVPVDLEALVGGAEGQGLLQAQQVFGYTRLMAARAYIEETAERIDAGEGSLNTEGAIAKYLATEAGNAAAEAAIQGHGGYGYTREYLVEKIKRDVRITTIYEGTSEIMEMTIARDRWQEHLKTRGRYYHDRGDALEALGGSHPGVGAGTAALALHALAEVLEWCRTARLTRQQHVLLRVGELIAHAECAEALSRRAARAADGTLSPKADPRFDASGLAVLARVFARDAALRVAWTGLALVRGGGGAEDDKLPELEAALRPHDIAAAEAGGIADMDAAADIVYGRSGRTS